MNPSPKVSAAISTCQYEVNKFHLGETAREWAGSIIVLMVRLQPSTRSPSFPHMEGPMWIRTIRRLNWVKISALRSGVTKQVTPTCFRETANPRFMGAGENRPGAVAVEQVLSLQLMQQYRAVAVSGSMVKKSIRPRFERYERFKRRKHRFQGLHYYFAIERASPAVQSHLANTTRLLALSSLGSAAGSSCLAGMKCTMGISQPRPPLRSAIALHRGCMSLGTRQAGKVASDRDHPWLCRIHSV